MKVLKILCVVLFSGLGFSTMAQTIIPKPYITNVSKGEFIPSEDHLYYMLFPQLIALSETLWTAPELKDYKDFKLRLKPILRGFDQKGVHYFKKFE